MQQAVKMEKQGRRTMSVREGKRKRKGLDERHRERTDIMNEPCPPGPCIFPVLLILLLGPKKVQATA